MDKIIVKGGERLEGTVSASGAKNAALPLLAATLLAPGKHTLRNVPDLLDVATMLKLLSTMGCSVERRKSSGKHPCHVEVAETLTPEAPYELVKTMRASVLVLGPLIARFGRG